MKGNARGIPLCARLLCGLELLGGRKSTSPSKGVESLWVSPRAHAGVVRLNNGSLASIQSQHQSTTPMCGMPGARQSPIWVSILQDFVVRR